MTSLLSLSTAVTDNTEVDERAPSNILPEYSLVRNIGLSSLTSSSNICIEVVAVFILGLMSYAKIVKLMFEGCVS